MAKLSVILATYNEEANIGACLKTVQGLADEIIVVDGFSRDQTVALAKKAGAKVFVKPNLLMFHQNKQLAIEKATGEWILYLDADERVSPELKKEILAVIGSCSTLEEASSATSQEELGLNNSSAGGRRPPPRSCAGYWLPRKNIIFGKWLKHTGWWPDRQLRLFKNGSAKLPCQSVHEQPELKGEAGELKNPLIHQNYQTVTQFINRLNHYTDNDKNVFLKTGREIHWIEAVIWPAQEFLRRFFQQKGYQDGLHGLVLSLLQAFSSLVTFAKIWEAKKFPEAALDLDKLAKTKNNLAGEWRYWFLTSKIDQTDNYLKKIIHQFERRLIGV
ncbi:hypothetical protein COU97_00040 [Candidatus Shapirobacteria bacterium CG10_big_fil_rev_8_21_14_0_10_48_15]|uniref:Glycosyltransferase 2-like domain-containing protein n=1 Tax=Candidatus Shapirobacteria bacterium CG10_big_fil_rev_8_21_14_0_10_48_15 TaxID=1974484 RepID=A0A2M8L830_9BACT|nr:MAG: hypothetical protein COU97_00040 [Candidatus Shapirobacteria bacterium CG10_big_fil_rev_8_21_14_0_10_48_15]